MNSILAKGSIRLTSLIAFVSIVALVFVASAASADAWGGDQRPSRAVQPAAQNLSPLAKESATDPTGDTFGVGATQIDITGLGVDVVGNTLVIDIDFGGTISAPDSGQANAVNGFVDIDADQNGATGDVPWTDFLTGSNATGMGNEFYVDLFTYDTADGSADVVDDSTDLVVGRAPVLVGGDAVLITIPLTLLNDDGAVNAATVLGTLGEPTDKAPNNGSVASAGGGTGNPETILLRGGRFEVGVIWWFLPDFPEAPALASDFRTDEAAIFTFQNADNLEFLVKVLDGCGNNNRFWVFFAAATNVGFDLTVTDTQTGQSKTYTNPQGQNADAVTDTQAFATCP